MATNFEWVKLILTHWKTIGSILTFLFSLNIFQFWNYDVQITKKDKELVETRDQVTLVANHLSNFNSTEVKDEKPITKTIIKKEIVQKCNCGEILNSHLRKYH